MENIKARDLWRNMIAVVCRQYTAHDNDEFNPTEHALGLIVKGFDLLITLESSTTIREQLRFN